MRVVSVEKVPKPAAGDGLGLQHQVVFVRWGGLPEFRPMRGDIDGLLSAACLGVGRSLQACRGRSFVRILLPTH
jgi:hypothetical protein